LLVAAIAGLFAGLALVEARPVHEAAYWADPTRVGADRVVFLADGLPDEERVAFTAALAGSGHPGVVLLDSEKSRAFNKKYLEQFQPRQLIPITSFAPAVNEVCKALIPQARTLVVAPAQPRTLLLQAACLAGALRAPLYISRGQPGDPGELRRCLKTWPLQEIYALGATCKLCPRSAKTKVRRLRDAEAVTAAYLALCRKQGPVETLVVANPADVDRGSAMSSLAPWLALQKRALLLLTDPPGDKVESLVHAAMKRPGVEHADSVILLGDLQALPMRRRPNPLPEGKDAFIEMEPMTPEGDAPHSFAVGRLFHQDPGMVALMLARSRLLKASSPPKALVASNPGGGLPLLESFSRNTARELANAGYDTVGLFEHQVNRAELRRLLPQQNIFLWEGHYSTLVRTYQVHQWPEPLRPSLVFLQSCLALSEDKALPFLDRGACAVIGTSTRTYSASGGAFALAYFNALLYERQSVGGSLRQAKNFLQAFAQLKEKRLGSQSKLGGANIRTSWAFTLWGDPTLRFPVPPAPADALPRVKHQVHGNTIRIWVPDVPHEKAAVGRYETEIWANSRIGGLLRTQEAGSKRLVPLVFSEIPLPQVPAEKTPALSSRLADRSWVFRWDARRRCGYLLVAPRAGDTELRFRVRWDERKES
jgi:hypothetical protein